MIRSMTGYGKAVKELADKRVVVEIRSVNSKQLDLNLKLSSLFREKEAEIRSILSSRLERGKVDIAIYLEYSTGQSNSAIDTALATHYYSELKKLSDELSLGNTDYLSIISRMPEVIKSGSEELNEQDWQNIFEALTEALDHLDEFRQHEGEILEKDYRMRINIILDTLIKIEPYEKQRVVTLKERIRKNLKDFMENENFDENRFEQELFYYLEKLDITEEKVRLKKHCDYFIQTLSADGFNGKKLNFITQEIGREVNTLGSKANDAEIQQLVVGMKDELEKVKEQLLNIL
jgi:uncharacterized protein (TIGR00255 family)